MIASHEGEGDLAVEHHHHRLDLMLGRGAALDLLQQIASGLSALHDTRLEGADQAGVVHRDLKPANVLIDTTGRVRLVDFGIAVVADEHSASEAWGTLAYMSPEQATGEPIQTTSDVFSFGALIYDRETLQYVPHDAQATASSSTAWPCRSANSRSGSMSAG